MNYPPIEPKRLNGTEPITDEQGNPVSDLNSFWIMRSVAHWLNTWLPAHLG